MKRLSILLVVALLAALSVFSASAQDDGGRQVGPITQAILDRGALVCGVNSTNLTGFAVVNDAGEYSGMDVDICRTVAAAILGDANAVEYRPLTASERPTALAAGEIDLLSRNTTWTLSRDTDWGATFGPTIFYDGQGIMVTADSGIMTIEDLEGGTICTNAGTTTELNISDAMGRRGLEFTLQTFQDFDGVMASYLEGQCDAITTDQSGLVARRANLANPGAHTILPVVISKEPLGPLSPASDPQFADIVRWSVWGLIQAEEFGITSENVADMVGSDDPNVQRFLGAGENLAGDYLGIPNDFMVNVISQVGNYGEIYEKHLTPLGLDRGLNALWTEGGLLYNPPFR